MTFYIVDDEQAAIDTMIAIIHTIHGMQVIGYSTDPSKALQEIGSGKLKPDITLVDIQMPAMSGMELAGLLYNKTTIIFITASGDFAAKAFEEDTAADYIIKPVSPERFLKGVMKVKLKMEVLKQKFIGTEEDDYFFLKMAGKSRYIRILKNDILYLEGAVNYVNVLVGDKKHMSHFTMTALEEILPSKHFIRIAKSYIINMQKVEKINGFDLEMSNGVHITIGQTYRRQFFERLNTGPKK